MEPLNLVAATSANATVCKLVNHVINKSMVIVENDLGTLSANNDKKLRHLVALPLGLATATLKLIATNHSDCNRSPFHR
jgi:hypothetical protein